MRGKLPVGGQRVQLLAQPAAFLQQLAELLLDGRQPRPKLVAAGSPAARRWLLSSCCRIASSEHCDAKRRFDFAGDRLALAPQHLGPGTFQRPLAELLLVLDAGFEEQLRGGDASAG